jgi:hypothetical protein
LIIYNAVINGFYYCKDDLHKLTQPNTLPVVFYINFWKKELILGTFIKIRNRGSL